MKKPSLGKSRSDLAQENSAGVFGRDLLKSEGLKGEGLKSGAGFRDVLMGDGVSENTSASSRKKETLYTRERKQNATYAPRAEEVVTPKRRPSTARGEASSEKVFKRTRGFEQVLPQSGEQKVTQRVKPARSESTHDSVEALKRKLAWKFGFKVFGILLLIFCCALLAVKWAKPITQFFEKPLKQVAVEGEFHFLSNARAMDLINAQIDGHFLQLDLEKLKRGLEADPWIEHVYLSRRWPDTLVVKISEQKPIARWMDVESVNQIANAKVDANSNLSGGFVNQNGELVRIKNLDPVIGLPWLKGDETNVHEIMQQYQDLSTLLRTRNLDILGLECDSKKSWRIHLKNNIEIVVGRDQVMEKLNRFLMVYDKFLNTVWKDVEAIDLRYTNGVSVRWLAESDMAKKYLKPDVVLPAKGALPAKKIN